MTRSTMTTSLIALPVLFLLASAGTTHGVEYTLFTTCRGIEGLQLPGSQWNAERTHCNKNSATAAARTALRPQMETDCRAFANANCAATCATTELFWSGSLCTSTPESWDIFRDRAEAKSCGSWPIRTRRWHAEVTVPKACGCVCRNQE